ncbi:ABC-type transport auxiliary lipoprotein family protein [Massilia sp. Se16.2.3]|uniref:ABC-type transport auxiliary lipoprotein family protein n=1 Tax=Massilia sp. Se16.2.3 TaxID=2709303 RepID=UPI001E42741B|nr:ABC-type transport auxiliary lipoprotein family protein [Massilia sp. Se16.2.3]
MNLSRILGAALLLSLAGCASEKAAPTTQFDFGPLGPPASQVAQAPLAAIVVTDATGSPAFENERMVYRLDYADPLQARTYANSRWTANPLLLVTQRLKSRLAQAGVKVLSATDTATTVPILRIEIDDFSHTFASTSASEGRLVLRASLFNGHALADQRTFTRATPAPSADAAGGARAPAASTDGAAADIVAWLAGFDNRKR